MPSRYTDLYFQYDKNYASLTPSCDATRLDLLRITLLCTFAYLEVMMYNINKILIKNG